VLDDIRELSKTLKRASTLSTASANLVQSALAITTP
jgi:hypothetical protein